MGLNPIWNKYPQIHSELEKVSEILIGCAKESPEGIRADLTQMLTNPGKMLRPAFTIIASSWGEKKDKIASVATAVEMLHIASLIHDDVLDHASKRRGAMTLHTSLGVKRAVLSGDYLLAKAMSLSVEEYNRDFLPTFLDGINRLCSSEIDQDFKSFNMNIEYDHYLKRIRGKTAELFGIACMAGAVSSGAPEDICNKLYSFGINFGLAFQIEDDILDYIGSSDHTGKDAGKDLAAGIPTLPLIEALEAEDRAITSLCKPFIIRLMPGLLRKKIVSRGYTDKAREKANSFRNEALRLLDEIPETEGSSILRELFDVINKQKK